MQKLQPVGIFHTPENVQELQDYLATFTGSDAVIANTAAFMAWNLCAKLTNTPDESEAE
tara:strand:- start:81 stop:257 length:177 start_codon:yes stop_codon:yes gene_type:complete